MDRRDFSKLLTLETASAALGAAYAQGTNSGTTPATYFVDGYHGGTRGHMPNGAWRDVLSMLRRVPEWKISLDIEPISWVELQRDDPESFAELQELLKDQSTAARVEMLNGLYGQPFGWAAGGESSIRQILRGRDVIAESFPGVQLDTFAVQEPCWTSCLPQILRSLGFSYAVLKDPGTAWGGYTAGFDAETVNWVGPDGTSIPTVPRYACEDLLRVYETESAHATPEFARKCAQHGIEHPAGTYLQDLGWPARPKVVGDHIRYTTWRQYMREVAAKPTKDWNFTQEDILVTLPWGEKTIQNLARQARSAENILMVAEKLAVMANAWAGVPYPAKSMRRAWDQTLWSQHHDAWITATTRAGRQAWAFQVATQTYETEEICREIIASSIAALSKSGKRSARLSEGHEWVRVFNTSSKERAGTVELEWSCDPGTHGVRIVDRAGNELPCQLVRPRKFLSRERTNALGRQRAEIVSSGGVPNYAQGESLNAATVVFRTTVPAMGFETLRVVPVRDEAELKQPTGAAAKTQPDGIVVLETDLYRIALDPSKGGAVTSLFAKSIGKEFTNPTSERRFNEYRGYFIEEQAWRSSTESPAQIRILENGPVRARVLVTGMVSGVRTQTNIALVQGQRRIDFETRFTYSKDTWIGDPWDIKPENRRSERRRSQNDGRWKLQASFPVPFEQQTIYKNSAYAVCRSRNTDTFFQGWHEIKHNIILNWVDLYDERLKLGLALLSDHTTAYSHGPDHPLSLVMGWGWEGGFWWGKCPLSGTQQVSYCLVPHAGTWEEAGIWQECEEWNEPFEAQRMIDAPDREAPHSLFSSVDPGIELPTALIDGDAILLRVFNAEGTDGPHAIRIGAMPSKVERVELDGRVVESLSVRGSTGGATEVTIELPRFAIRTLRIVGIAARA